MDGQERGQFLRGSLEIAILTILRNRGEMHGYALWRELEKKPIAALCVAQGTLYALLIRLEGRRLVRKRWVAPPGKKRGRFLYSLTPKGGRSLDRRRSIWEGISAAVQRILREQPA